MSLAECPVVSSRGWALCPDCGDELHPWDPHPTCDVSVLKSLALALSQGAMTMPDDDRKCPRCGSPDDLMHVGGEHACQTRCGDCAHTWGDGYPDSQERPLPDGFVDCPRCDGLGGQPYSLSNCRTCNGDGIVRTALTG